MNSLISDVNVKFSWLALKCSWDTHGVTHRIAPGAGKDVILMCGILIHILRIIIGLTALTKNISLLFFFFSAKNSPTRPIESQKGVKHYFLPSQASNEHLTVVILKSAKESKQANQKSS